MTSRTFTLTAITTFALTFALGFGGAFMVRQRTSDTVRTVAIDTVGPTSVADTVADTTTALALDSTLAPDTTSVTTEPASTTTTTRRPKPTVPPRRSTPPLNGEGAVLTAPDSPEPHQLNPDDQCASLASSGAADLCDVVTVGDREYAWVFEGGGQGVSVLTGDPDLPEVFRVGLRSGALPSQKPRFVDVTGDGQPEIVLGWRGDDGVLQVDVVEILKGSLAVTLHLRLVDGRLSAGGGSLDAWDGIPQPGDDTSSPTSFDRWSYTQENGKWVATVERDDSPPTGQL
jgi:hypothetical protein